MFIGQCMCMFAHSCMGAYLCAGDHVHACAVQGQRITLGVVHQAPSTFCLRRGLLMVWNLAKQARLTGPQSSRDLPATASHLPPHLGFYMSSGHTHPRESSP